MPLCLKCLGKIHVCIFAVLIFLEIFQKKSVPRIRLIFPIRFLRFADRQNPQNRMLSKIVGPGSFFGGEEIVGP